jgi:tight adherence protein B
LDCAKSLNELACELSIKEFSSFAAVIEISSRVGGNLPAMLESQSLQLSSDLLLNKKLEVQTAQGKSSVRMVSVIPLVLIAIMSLLMPGYLAEWLSTTGGQFAMLCALLLMSAGILWVRKVVRIDV